MNQVGKTKWVEVFEADSEAVTASLLTTVAEIHVSGISGPAKR